MNILSSTADIQKLEDIFNRMSPDSQSAFATFFLVFFGIIAIFAIIQIIAYWKLFKKANEAGWKAIIPIYNIIVLYKIIGITPWIIVGLFIISLVGGFVASPVVESICILIYGVITIYQSYMLSKSFGKGIGYTLGLIFLSPIFTLMLAFGSAKYVGPGGK